jgi:hypothetical protein
MKKPILFSIVYLIFPIILSAQHFQDLNENTSSRHTKVFEQPSSMVNLTEREYDSKKILAPKPHYYNFEGRHVVMASAGISLGGLRMNKSEIVEVLAKPSPLFNLSVFKHTKGFSFQSGLGISLHRFEVETTSVNERKMDFMFLEIPLMARYHFSPAFFTSVGFAPAFNLSTRSDFDFNTGRPEPDEEMYSKHDTAKNAISNVRICVGYLFPSGMSIQANYTKALGNVFNEGWDEKSFGFVDLQIGYALFAKR